MALYQMSNPPSAEPIGERVARIETSQDHILTELEKMSKQMTHMTTILDQAKGGWKVMLWVGTISGAIGAAIVKLFPWLLSLPR